MGSGIGAMILSPLVGAWIGSLGWRVTYKILGVLIGITLIPIVFLIIKIHPEEMGLSPYGNSGKDVDVLETIGDGMMLREVLTSIRFWALLMALVLFSIGGAPLMLILVPHLVDINYSIEFSAFIMAIASGTMAFGKLLLGYLFDKIGIRMATITSTLAAAMD